MVSGIYTIKNKVNDKIYVGQSIDVHDRLIHHKSKLRNNKHHSNHLQSSWNKYGEDAFEFELLKACKPRYLNRLEKLYVKIYDSMNPDKGYNLQSGGDSNYLVSDETRNKLSGANNPNYGKPLNPITKMKISQSRKGKYSGKNNPMYGKSHSIETRKKISDSLLGNKLSSETKEKMSKSKNTTGFFRVTKQNSKSCKQGFRWMYQYYDGTKRKSLTSLDLDKLKEKVLSRGLEWREIIG